jgi:beta-lactamase regulating signal transducer with metallopeptidase domain
MTDWLLGTLLATSALLLLVLVVREPVRKHFGSRVAYGLWLIPAARLFMPTLTRTVERTSPMQTSFEPPLHPLASEPVSMAHVAITAPSVLDEIGWSNLLVMIWLGVAAGLFLSRLIAFHRDRSAIIASSDRVTRLGSVRIVRTPDILSPVALGIVKPIIAVPSDFSSLYKMRERRLVLEHELAHHRSGDLVANFAAFVFLCLQWFNPLAWLAHAAFRFDQEAACDARVLDKASAADRADYGRAIAKAASGRALLFASALDHRNSLQRRLKSMLLRSGPRRRLAGRLMVASAIAAILPLTASHAIQYVDVAAPAAPSARFAPASAVTSPKVVVPATVAAVQVAPTAAVPAVRPTPPAPASSVTPTIGDLTIHDDRITINGTTKRWEDLTPAEKAEVRSAVSKARTALENTHLDQVKLTKNMAALQQIRFGDLQRNLAQAQAGVAQALEGIDASQPYLRWSGQDPEQLKATIRNAMASVQAIDPEAIQRAVGAIDQHKIAQSVAQAQESMRAAKAELDRMDARIRKDQNK